MTNTGFENEERVDLSALSRLSGSLFNAASPTDAFRATNNTFSVTTNERANILNHRFGPKPEATTLAPTIAAASDFDFGTGAIDLSALKTTTTAPAEMTMGETTPRAAPPTIKAPTYPNS